METLEKKELVYGFEFKHYKDPNVRYRFADC